jgi:hypothetical protein
MKKGTLFFVFFLMLNSFVFSQKKTKLPCIDKEFSVVAHIVKDSLGNTNITESFITNLVNSLNPTFDSICVSFKVCEFRYIENFIYDTLSTSKKEWEELQNQYHVPNRINIFFVDDIPEPPGTAGFADLANICVVNSGGIVMKKSTATFGVLAHEMGHYFGLLHTFQDSQNSNIAMRELVDGSNSTSTGDHITDTPADPYDPAFKIQMYTKFLSNNPKTPCKFIGVMQDAQGKYYDPLVGNIMSYYPESCLCGFTHEQYLKMANTFLSNPKMW